MLLAVATTKASPSFSCIQVRNAPKSLVVTSAPPPDAPIPAKAFSNSSIQRTQGDMASARAMAWRRLASDSPTYFPMSRPISRRRRGTSKSAAAALALRDFPQPGSPAMRTPLGRSTPNASALSIFFRTFALRLSHALRFSSPPMSSMRSFKGTISMMPDFCTICFFCS